MRHRKGYCIFYIEAARLSLVGIGMQKGGGGDANVRYTVARALSYSARQNKAGQENERDTAARGQRTLASRVKKRVNRLQDHVMNTRTARRSMNERG